MTLFFLVHLLTSLFGLSKFPDIPKSYNPVKRGFLELHEKGDFYEKLALLIYFIEF
jgi:hypothetical protein